MLKESAEKLDPREQHFVAGETYRTFTAHAEGLRRYLLLSPRVSKIKVFEAKLSEKPNAVVKISKDNLLYC